MTLDTRDDPADAQLAIEQAEAAPDRRAARRIRRRVATQMVPWRLGVPAVPFSVVIEDISRSGIGVVHTEPLPLGMQYVLTLPRAGMHSTVVVCEVVRCEQAGSRLHRIGLSSAEPIEHVERTRDKMRLTSRDTRILFLLFGIFGLILAVFLPI